MAQGKHDTTGHAPEFPEFATFTEAERDAARLRSLMVDHLARQRGRLPA